MSQEKGSDAKVTFTSHPRAFEKREYVKKTTGFVGKVVRALVTILYYLFWPLIQIYFGLNFIFKKINACIENAEGVLRVILFIIMLPAYIINYLFYIPVIIIMIPFTIIYIPFFLLFEFLGRLYNNIYKQGIRGYSITYLRESNSGPILKTIYRMYNMFWKVPLFLNFIVFPIWFGCFLPLVIVFMLLGFGLYYSFRYTVGLLFVKVLYKRKEEYRIKNNFPIIFSRYQEFSTLCNNNYSKYPIIDLENYTEAEIMINEYEDCETRFIFLTLNSFLKSKFKVFTPKDFEQSQIILQNTITLSNSIKSYVELSLPEYRNQRKAIRRERFSIKDNYDKNMFFLKSIYQLIKDHQIYRSKKLKAINSTYSQAGDLKVLSADARDYIIISKNLQRKINHQLKAITKDSHLR
ncbi:MAG: hypothetical protein ACTSP5_03415 [Candidatus Heimdallarchaeota archaeon]